MIVDMRRITIPVFPITDLKEIKALTSMIAAGGIPPVIFVDSKLIIIKGKFEFIAHKQLGCGGIRVHQVSKAELN